MLNLSSAKYDKFSSIERKPRCWQWVDPPKNTQANVIAVANGFKIRQGIVSEAADQVAISLNQSEDGF
jgi:capsid protein